LVNRKGNVSDYNPISFLVLKTVWAEDEIHYVWLIAVFCVCNFSGSAAQRGLWSPRPRGFLITRNDAPQSVGLLWTSDQLVAETST
jgi:hypothetical protein